LQNKLIFPLAAITVAASMLFGGGARHGLLSDSIPQIFAVLLLFVVSVPAMDRIKDSAFHIVLVALVIILPLIQLIPLPAGIWLALPGRSELREMYSALQIEPTSLSLSLRPSETWRSFMSILPALAVGLSIAALDLRARIYLILMLLIFSGLNVFLGLGQLVGGTSSSLYFYDVTNRGRAVGFFANSNHYTAFLYATLPFAAALFSGSSGRSAPVRNIVLALSVFILLVGLSISGSRTAILLGSISFILSLMMIANKTVARLLSKGTGKALASLSFIILVPVLLGVGLFQIFVRIQTQDPFEDLRYKILGTLYTLVRDLFPFGSGFGSFERIYQTKEALDTVIPSYVNHAHNDYLEIFIEGGLPAMIAVALILSMLSQKAFSTLYKDVLIEERIEKASIISLWLLLVHSAWDYPLRTIAVSTLFGLALGSLIKPHLINVETIADVIRHLRHSKLYEWLESRGSGKRRRRRQPRLPELPGSGDVLSP
jgi:O-antigen ligase